GRRVPGASWLHRTPAGPKLAGVAALSVLVLRTRDPGVNGRRIAGSGVLALTARLPPRDLLAPILRTVLIVAGGPVAPLWLTDWLAGARIASTIVACVLAAALLMLTTTIGELIAVFEVLARPLAVVGLPAESVGLAAGLVVR